MSKASRRNKFASKLVFALIMALVLLVAVSCGKKEEKVVTPAPTTTVTQVKSEPATAPVVKEEAPVVEAPVVEEPVVEVEEPAVEVEEPVAEVEEPVVEEVAEAPAALIIERTIGGVTYKMEAYDGYGYIYYPETYAEEKVDAFIEALVNANPEIMDQVGWVVEEPGMVIVAYPFGLTETELNAYATAVETMFK